MECSSVGRIVHIKSDGEVLVLRENITSDEFNAKSADLFNMMRTVLKTEFIEFVWVLYDKGGDHLTKGKRTLMIVDELGAIGTKSRDPLPVNGKATEIYHNASRARGKDWYGAPYIHGDAILLEDIDVE